MLLLHPSHRKNKHKKKQKIRKDGSSIWEHAKDSFCVSEIKKVIICLILVSSRCFPFHAFELTPPIGKNKNKVIDQATIHMLTHLDTFFVLSQIQIRFITCCLGFLNSSHLKFQLELLFFRCLFVSFQLLTTPSS